MCLGRRCALSLPESGRVAHRDALAGLAVCGRMLRKSSGFAGRGCSERVRLILRPLNLIRAEGIETLSCCPPYVFEALAEGFASPPYKQGRRWPYRAGISTVIRPA